MPNNQDSPADEFQDPLENYDPQAYDDPVERALSEENVSAIQHEPVARVSPDTPVGKAVEKLAGMHVACLLVEDEGKLVGIFSDRDVLDRVAIEFTEIKDRPVRDFMTTAPVHVYDTDCSAAVLSVMAVSGYRHVPVLSLDGRLVGIVSPQRVTSFLRAQFAGDR